MSSKFMKHKEDRAPGDDFGSAIKDINEGADSDNETPAVKSPTSVANFTVAEYGTIVNRMQDTITTLRQENQQLKSKIKEVERETQSCAAEAVEAIKISKLAAQEISEAMVKILDYMRRNNIPASVIAGSVNSRPQDGLVSGSLDQLNNASAAMNNRLAAQGISSPDDKDLKLSALELERQNLPVVKGWIFKKASTGVFGWQKRFGLVHNFNLYYSKTEIRNVGNAIESETGIHTIPLVAVVSIEEHVMNNADALLKFTIGAKEDPNQAPRLYKFKCSSESDRHMWFSGIKLHWDLLQKLQA